MKRGNQGSNAAAAQAAIGSRNGLTLVESLAAAAAIALTITMLAPALAGVRGRSKQTVCLQNLARIAEASIVYATADPDDQAVPIHRHVPSPYASGEIRRALAAVGWGGKSGLGMFGGDQYFWGTVKDMGPADRLLNKILYGDVFPDYSNNPGPGGVNWWRDASLDLSVYRCPSDGGYTGIHDWEWRASRLSAFDHYGNSYVAATFFAAAPPGSPNCLSTSVYWHALGDIVNPARTLYYIETCGRWAYTAAPQGNPGVQCGSGNTSEIVHGWHGQPWQFNAAFVDGHAAPIHMRGFQNPPLGHYPDSDGWADQYAYWHCGIVRGDGWQLDALPLPPVQVPSLCD
ncbi:MAG: hypothetical protein GY778_05850 [bacterium]|nr:hypothetical protein [bacterium]